MSSSQQIFHKTCRQCVRLTEFLGQVKKQHPDYYCAPVPAFGDQSGRFLVVGLAPGMHGANATGRPFTGDYAGILLYQTLHHFGFASLPKATSPEDGLTLSDCRITNSVKCLPPGNRPTAQEINNCNRYLANELQSIPSPAVILALGGIAHKAIIKALCLKQSGYPFTHGHEYSLPGGRVLIDSYHCSRYNTQTRRLTEEMFYKVFKRIRKLLIEISVHTG